MFLYYSYIESRIKVKRTWTTMFLVWWKFIVLIYARRVFNTRMYIIFTFLLKISYITHTIFSLFFFTTLAPINRRNFCVRCSSPRSACSQSLAVWIWRKNKFRIWDDYILTSLSVPLRLESCHYRLFLLCCHYQSFHPDVLWWSVAEKIDFFSSLLLT